MFEVTKLSISNRLVAAILSSQPQSTSDTVREGYYHKAFWSKLTTAGKPQMNADERRLQSALIREICGTENGRECQN
jgi:hypothetical protein